jgi:hypothetical protein
MFYNFYRNARPADSGIGRRAGKIDFLQKPLYKKP